MEQVRVMDKMVTKFLRVVGSTITESYQSGLKKLKT